MRCWSPSERALLVGYIVNKFRGDPALFDEAHPMIEARTGLRSLGVVTWLERARDLPKEDILGLGSWRGGRATAPRRDPGRRAAAAAAGQFR